MASGSDPVFRKKRGGRGIHCVGDASEIKSRGHPVVSSSKGWATIAADVTFVRSAQTQAEFVLGIRLESALLFMPMPNSFPWMESVDAEMIRAHEHLETLERETSEYLSTIKPTIVLKTAPEEPWPWLVMWVNDYIPPIRLSVLLRDCVHNMRSLRSII
jgi:hypothetical protein